MTNVALGDEARRKARELGGRPVYVYDGLDELRERGSETIAIVLDAGDATRWHQVREREDEILGRYDVGTFVSVVDQLSGERVLLATAPCGLGCRCAAVIKREA